MTVSLASFRKNSAICGRSRSVQGLWYLTSCLIFRQSWLPGSGWRVHLLRAFGATVGDGVQIKTGVRIKFPWKLTIGENSWIGEDCWIDNMAQVTLGRDVCLSQGCYLCTGNHDWSDRSFSMFVQEITLADGCWVASRCTLGPGVTVGRNSIAAIGSVVSRSIPEGEIHGGNPALLRGVRRFSSSSAPAEIGVSSSAASGGRTAAELTIG